MKLAVFGFLAISLSTLAHASPNATSNSASNPLNRDGVLQNKIAASVNGQENYIGPRVSKSFEDCRYSLLSGANNELKIEVYASSNNRHLGALAGVDVFGIQKTDLPLRNGFQRHIQRLPYGLDSVVSYNKGVLSIESKNLYESFGAKMQGAGKAQFRVSPDLKEIKSADGDTSLTVNGALNLSSKFSCKF